MNRAKARAKMVAGLSIVIKSQTIGVNMWTPEKISSLQTEFKLFLRIDVLVEPGGKLAEERLLLKSLVPGNRREKK